MPPGVPFHVPPGQVPGDSTSPDTQIAIGNYLGAGGQYMTIQDDTEAFTFKKELHSGHRHAQHTCRRGAICAGDVDITVASPFRVKKLDKKEVARVKSDLLVTFRKWDSDRAKHLAIDAERASVAPFQSQAEARSAAPEAPSAAAAHDDDDDF